MILSLIGGDLFSKERRIEAFLSETLKELKDDPLSKQILYATDTNIAIVDKVMESCASVSMFSPEQAIVVRRAEALKAADMHTLADWLNTNPSGSLLFEFEKLAATTDLYKALKKCATIEKYELPKPWEMEKWISNLAITHFNKAIDPLACRYLSEAIGTDTALIAAEMEKIILFAPTCKEISLELVKTMVVPQREIQAFEIRESFGNRDASAFVRKTKELLDNGVTGIQIASALYHYSVRLLHVNSLLEQGMPPKEIAKKLGANEYLFCIKENEPQRAKKWNKKLLCRIIKRLADLDFEIKSGQCSSRMSQELALAALIVR